MKTTISTSVMPTMALDTSSIVTSAASRGGLAVLDVPLDVFDHDDGVIDHDADGEDQAEQRQQVQREPQAPA